MLLFGISIRNRLKHLVLLTPLINSSKVPNKSITEEMKYIRMYVVGIGVYI